jgi:trans-aconitate methyltransferase
MGSNIENGSSVYCHRTREQGALYKAVRGIAERYSRGKWILDLGSSDLPASRLLIESGYQIIGLDLEISCLEKAKKRNPEANFVQADLTKNLPFNRNIEVESVLLLDVLEHLEKEEAIRLLKNLADHYPQACIILSIPIISPFSIPCLYELLQAIRQRKRPLTGLFDRTHKILVNRSGHLNIFSKAGYEISETYTTNMFEGLTGHPEYLGNNPCQSEPSKKRVLRTFYDHLPEKVNDQLFSYQALYVLRTK